MEGAGFCLHVSLYVWEEGGEITKCRCVCKGGEVVGKGASGKETTLSSWFMFEMCPEGGGESECTYDAS